MICPYCSEQFAEASDLVEHLEGKVCQTRDESIGRVNGLAEVMARNSRSPNTRAEPTDFGLL